MDAKGVLGHRTKPRTLFKANPGLRKYKLPFSTRILEIRARSQGHGRAKVVIVGANGATAGGLDDRHDAASAQTNLDVATGDVEVKANLQHHGRKGNGAHQTVSGSSCDMGPAHEVNRKAKRKHKTQQPDLITYKRRSLKKGLESFTKLQVLNLEVRSPVANVEGDSSLCLKDAEEQVALLEESDYVADEDGQFQMERFFNYRFSVYQEFSLKDIHYRALLGQPCRVYWPVDHTWYPGVVYDFNHRTGKHKVVYTDDESEWLLLADERVQLLAPPGDDLYGLQYSSEYSYPAPVAKNPPNAVETKLSFSQQASRDGPRQQITALRSFPAATCPAVPATEAVSCEPDSCSLEVANPRDEPQKLDTDVSPPQPAGTSPAVVDNSGEEGNEGTGTRRVGRLRCSRLPAAITKFYTGEPVWAQMKGYCPWPAVIHEDRLTAPNGTWLGRCPGTGKGDVVVQFFGSYEHSKALPRNRVKSLADGARLGFHVMKKSFRFRKLFLQGVAEMTRYASQRMLPASMLDPLAETGVVEEQLDDPMEIDPPVHEGPVSSAAEQVVKEVADEDSWSTDLMPLVAGKTKVFCLGDIVTDSKAFHNDKFIWPEGFSAVRKFPSCVDPMVLVDHHLEIARDASGKAPLFRISTQDGQQVEAKDPLQCWKEIARRVDKARAGLVKLGYRDVLPSTAVRSGPSMFGLTDPRVAYLIQCLPNARSACPSFTAWIQHSAIADTEKRPAGFVPVPYTLCQGDCCQVCFRHEEYDENQLLQCDSCLAMVHMDCYGERQLPDGDEWLCQPCETNVANSAPYCCLCPVQGGVLKRTDDRRWVHVSCAIWINETWVEAAEVKGISSISQRRWKLECSECHLAWGACIQCCVPKCYTAYHVLCAAQAGHLMEYMVEDDVPSHLPKSAGSHNGELRLLSYCQKHKPTKQKSPDRAPASSAQVGPAAARVECSCYCPPCNSTGCARSEPFNTTARRGRREPEAVAAALAKRSFVENVPYVITGRRRSAPPFAHSPNKSARALHNWHWAHWGLERRSSPCEAEIGGSRQAREGGRGSMSERWRKMKSTQQQRLAIGKSAIHGMGVFTKVAHRTGDMVIEYVGEVVRPVIADIRERRKHDGRVGVGTYMFRIDDERVVDATDAGSTAHLINHACEPNCYSRVVRACDEDHIIIFAKRDISSGEELTYDYRFNSKDDQLVCNCGCTGCRGVVNCDSDGDDDDKRMLVPRSELQPQCS